MDVKITDLSTLQPKDITILNDPDASTITLSDPTTTVTVATDQLAITTSAESSNLGDLKDVNITSVSNGQLIAYNSSTNKWENSASSTGVTSVNTQTGVVVLDTDNIAEGSSNLYYTNARFNTQLGTKTTANLTEGANLYYTDARVQTKIDANSAGFITASSSNTLTNKSGNISQWTNDSSYLTSVPAQSFASLTGKPTTVAGYGITDAVTASSSTAFTNKTGNISQWTNDAGYLTSETDSQTLSFSSPNLSISGGNSVDISAIASAYLPLAGGALTGALTTNSTIDGVDIATRDGVLTSTTTTANAALPKTGGTMSGAIAMGTSKITGLGDPTATQDAATKAYVDATTSGAGYISNVVEDTSPQLGGNLDVNGNDIVSTSNAAIELDPNGSGKVTFKGNATRGAGQFVLNCENNSHGITIKGPPHSAAASYTLTLPNNDGDADQVLKTDGSGVLSWTANTGGLANVVDDTSPQLGGNLDVNGQSIVTASNGNIVIDANGTGTMTIEGDGTTPGSYADRLARLAKGDLTIDSNQTNAWWGTQLMMKDSTDDVFAMIGRVDTSNKVYGYSILTDPNGTHKNTSAYTGDYGFFFNMEYEGGSGSDEWNMLHNVFGADDGYFINSIGSNHVSYNFTPLKIRGNPVELYADTNGFYGNQGGTTGPAFKVQVDHVDFNGLKLRDTSGSLTLEDNVTVNLDSAGTTALVTENESATANGNRITVGKSDTAQTSGVGFEVRRGTGSGFETQFKVETATSRTRTTVTSAFNLAPVAHASLHGAPSIGDMQFLTTDSTGASKNKPIYYDGSNWKYMNDDSTVG